MLERISKREEGATIFGYWVRDPQRYGVAEFDADGRIVGIEEKPDEPKSNYAITGLYFYDARAADFADQLKPSARGELEITDLNLCYLEAGDLQVEKIGRGTAWLDTGTFEGLIEAANYIETMEKRQGLKIACPEEIAYLQGWITADDLQRQAEQYDNNSYGEYLGRLARYGSPD